MSGGVFSYLYRRQYRRRHSGARGGEMSTNFRETYRKLKMDKAIADMREDIGKLTFAVAVARNNIKDLKKRLKKLKVKK